MPSMFAYVAPLALLFPIMGQGDDWSMASPKVNDASASLTSAGASEESPAPTAQSRQSGFPKGALPAPRYPVKPAAVAPLDALRSAQVVNQVRIERRVILRVQPRQPQNRNDLLAQLPQRSLQTQFEERKMDKCLQVGSIAGVQTGSGNRLLLFMRDSRIVSVNLEKACRARDFYSGFYVEKNADGKLCVDRDKLQSRSGAKCEVERMRQLVAVNE